MISGKYILVGHEPVPCEDLEEWAHWFETADRRVARTTVGAYMVSTVFLGVDHNWMQNGPPILFETMVFPDPDMDVQERCSTWAEAEAQHARIVATVATVRAAAKKQGKAKPQARA